MKFNERALMYLASSAMPSDKASYLYKRGAFMNTDYKKRYFVIKGNLMFYWKEEKDFERQGNPIGAVVLESCYAEAGRPTGDEGGDKYFTFKVVFDAADSRDYELACETEELMLAWMKAIQTAGHAKLNKKYLDLQAKVKRLEEEQAANKLAEEQQAAAAAANGGGMVNRALPQPLQGGQGAFPPGAPLGRTMSATPMAVQMRPNPGPAAATTDMIASTSQYPMPPGYPQQQAMANHGMGQQRRTSAFQ